jgi:hypothetical protein
VIQTGERFKPIAVISFSKASHIINMTLLLSSSVDRFRSPFVKPFNRAGCAARNPASFALIRAHRVPKNVYLS